MSASSGLLGVEASETVVTRRSGVGVEVDFESFFLWDRVPLLVRLPAVAPGVECTAEVVGVESADCEEVGRGGLRADRAS